MCGLVGYVSGGLSKEWLDVLLQSMTHRGPDGDGRYHFGSLSIGMRRLSVIDLEGGWQPLRSREGRVVVFQNGEIYNYRQLRTQLEARNYVFRTASDTEVIAHGYDAWSLDGLLERLDGMYAIAIHDQDTNELHLARDRFGEKPLFYSATSEGFAFGSTLLSVGVMPWVSGDVDRLSLERYLALHFVPGRQTILRDVERVLPGERLTVKLDGLALQHYRYYQVPLGPARNVDDVELISNIEYAVHSRLVADVPVGVFLSGGLDSATLASIVSRSTSNISTFSIGFDDREQDESDAARRVARFIGSRHHEFVFNSDRFNDLFPRVADALDEPIGDQATLPLYWLCQEVKRAVTVVLSGEGADEIFGGYSYYQSFVDKGDWRERLKVLLDVTTVPVCPSWSGVLIDKPPCTPSGFPLLSNAADRSWLLGDPESRTDRWEKELLTWLARARDPLQRATAVDVASWLVDDLLVKVDRMTMAHSLEGRAPYLSPALVDLAINLPQKERMTQRITKVALRRVARNYLPDDIVNRQKHGFVLPMRGWLRDWFNSHGIPQAYFSGRPFPYLNMVRLADLVDEDLRNGVRRERLLFAIIMLLEWWHAFRSKRANLVALCKRHASIGALS
jgi:asparagine synthase (glutamine-hydrolysing)